MPSLLTLLDDIVSTLDDVSAMTKVALRKTSALMTDDLAVNSGVIHGVTPDKELPMVWRIFVGSLLNKVVCIVGVLVLLAVYPPVLTVILFIGGLYLAYEGAHKVHEKLFHKDKGKKDSQKLTEKQKVRGAIKTDFVLSIEIIVIANSAITSGGFTEKILTLSLVGILASIIIYGLVALIVKIDDLGLYLIKKEAKKVGLFLVRSMPYIMQALGIIGTIAMFLVGGGIISHIFHLPIYVFEMLQNLVIGTVVGFAALVLLGVLKPLISKKKAKAETEVEAETN